MSLFKAHSSCGEKFYGYMGTQDELEEGSSDELDEYGYGHQVTKPIVNFWDDEDRGFYPETVPRSCQDTFCLLIYVVAAAVFVAICYVGINHNLVAQRASWQGY